jgi:hypothetical protein
MEAAQLGVAGGAIAIAGGVITSQLKANEQRRREHEASRRLLTAEPRAERGGSTVGRSMAAVVCSISRITAPTEVRG